jgi:hypothetical protein
MATTRYLYNNKQTLLLLSSLPSRQQHTVVVLQPELLTGYWFSLGRFDAFLGFGDSLLLLRQPFFYRQQQPLATVYGSRLSHHFCYLLSGHKNNVFLLERKASKKCHTNLRQQKKHATINPTVSTMDIPTALVLTNGKIINVLFSFIFLPPC